MGDKLLASLRFAAVLVALASTAMASTTWYVNGVSGINSNACTSPTTACKTIGHAISLATSGDSIRVAAATYKEHLAISISLSIFGASARTTILDGGGSGIVVAISSTTAHVTLSGVTITNGFWLRGGAGISNNGALRLLRSTVSGNHTALSVCPFPNGCLLKGGGIFNAAGASMTLGNSTVWNNSVSINGCSQFNCATQGGGIYNGGTLVVYNSTISGNHAGPNGTGVGIYSAGTATIRSSTLAGNSGVVRGIYGRATVENTILANAGTNGVNCGGIVTSTGYNLSNDTSCHSFTSAGDLNNSDPMLGPLQYNGGQTQTMALPLGSPAVDAGNPTGCTDGLGHLLKTDQRGKPRPDAEETVGCDIGAYEYQGAQQIGHCVYVCGSTRCGELTGYCSGPVNGACRRTFDPGQCPVGKPAGGYGSSCGEAIDTTRTCTP